jgi:hypothetical protein
MYSKQTSSVMDKTEKNIQVSLLTTMAAINDNNASLSGAPEFSYPDPSEGTEYALPKHWHSKTTKLRVACIGAGPSGMSRGVIRYYTRKHSRLITEQGYASPTKWSAKWTPKPGSWHSTRRTQQKEEHGTRISR